MSRATVQVMKWQPSSTSQVRVLKWWLTLRVLSNIGLAGKGTRIESMYFLLKTGGKDRLPSTIFQGLTVKLRRGTFWKEDLLKNYQVMNIEVFDNLTYESEMFLLSQLQLSKRLLQNNMAFAAVWCLNNNLKAKKHIISINQIACMHHFTILHPTFPFNFQSLTRVHRQTLFPHEIPQKTPRNPLFYQKNNNFFTQNFTPFLLENLPTKTPFLLVHLPYSRDRWVVTFSRSGSHGAGLCLFDVLGNLDLSKRNARLVV